MSSACHGRVVWVTIHDPQGRNPKCRPAVILTPTDAIKPDGDVWVVGITTNFERATPEVQTELQYDPRGNCRSGLRERCWAVATWVTKVPVSAIEGYAGVIPGRQMAEIHQKIEALPTE
jgi:mRNA-degrading endonuclease toxin of MazEF toxin-antitoxin module